MSYLPPHDTSCVTQTISDYSIFKTSKKTKNIAITGFRLWISYQKAKYGICQYIQAVFFISWWLIRPQKTAVGDHFEQSLRRLFLVIYRRSPSRISRKSFTSSDGSAGFSSAVGSSSFLLSRLIPFTTKKMTRATIVKSMID